MNCCAANTARCRHGSASFLIRLKTCRTRGRRIIKFFIHFFYYIGVFYLYFLRVHVL